MYFAYPEFQKSMNGINNDLFPETEYSVQCSSDHSFCPPLFSNTIDESHYWATGENGYAQITFKRKLFVISHYSLKSAQRENHPKTVIVKGKKKNGVFVTIDFIEESQLNSRFAVETRVVNNTGPFVGIKFVITDAWGFSSDNYFSGLHGIALFGSLIKRNVVSGSMMDKAVFYNYIVALLVS